VCHQERQDGIGRHIAGLAARDHLLKPAMALAGHRDQVGREADEPVEGDATGASASA
jgi:hypothetical protein